MESCTCEPARMCPVCVVVDAELTGTVMVRFKLSKTAPFGQVNVRHEELIKVPEDLSQPDLLDIQVLVVDAFRINFLESSPNLHMIPRLPVVVENLAHLSRHATIEILQFIMTAYRRLFKYLSSNSRGRSRSSASGRATVESRELCRHVMLEVICAHLRDIENVYELFVSTDGGNTSVAVLKADGQGCIMHSSTQQLLQDYMTVIEKGGLSYIKENIQSKALEISTKAGRDRKRQLAGESSAQTTRPRAPGKSKWQNIRSAIVSNTKRKALYDLTKEEVNKLLTFRDDLSRECPHFQVPFPEVELSYLTELA